MILTHDHICVSLSCYECVWSGHMFTVRFRSFRLQTHYQIEHKLAHSRPFVQVKCDYNRNVYNEIVSNVFIITCFCFGRSAEPIYVQIICCYHLTVCYFHVVFPSFVVIQSVWLLVACALFVQSWHLIKIHEEMKLWIFNST